MVLPLYDDNSDRTLTPYINYALIAANVLVFVFLQQLGSNEHFTYAFSTVPLVPTSAAGGVGLPPDQLVVETRHEYDWVGVAIRNQLVC